MNGRWGWKGRWDWREADVSRVKHTLWAPFEERNFNHTTFPLMNLPYDIILNIVQLLSIEELSIVSRTTRRLRDQLQPILFKEFATKVQFEEPGFTSFLRTILDSPELAKCVKRVDTSRWNADSLF